TQLIVLFPFQSFGIGGYWLFVVGVSIAGAALTYLATNRDRVIAVTVALAGMFGGVVVDVASGAHLQFNAAFGYSPTVGGRFAGLGNMGYAQLAAAGVLLAGLVAWRVGGRAGASWAAALLVVAIAVDGAPYLGADVGGVLSMVPAFGVTI